MGVAAAAERTISTLTLTEHGQPIEETREARDVVHDAAVGPRQCPVSVSIFIETDNMGNKNHMTIPLSMAV